MKKKVEKEMSLKELTKEVKEQGELLDVVEETFRKFIDVNELVLKNIRSNFMFLNNQRSFDRSFRKDQLKKEIDCMNKLYKVEDEMFEKTFGKEVRKIKVEEIK